MRIVQRAWEAPSPTDFAAKTVRILWSDGSASTVKVPQTVENGQIRSWRRKVWQKCHPFPFACLPSP